MIKSQTNAEDIMQQWKRKINSTCSFFLLRKEKRKNEEKTVWKCKVGKKKNKQKIKILFKSNEVKVLPFWKWTNSIRCFKQNKEKTLCIVSLYLSSVNLSVCVRAWACVSEAFCWFVLMILFISFNERSHIFSNSLFCGRNSSAKDLFWR